MGKMPSRGTEGGTRYSALLGRHGRCQLLHALLGNHQNGSESTASAAVSIASCTGLPTTGTTDATAPPTRIGTVATLVTKHPDSPTNSNRSVSHLIPDILNLLRTGAAKRNRQIIDGTIPVCVSTGCECWHLASQIVTYEAGQRKLEVSYPTRRSHAS